MRMSHLFRRFRLHFLALLLPLLTLLASPAQARCTGQNLLDALSPDESARLAAATDRQPFARGNLWQATRGTDRLTLLGTYHLSDPRHDRMISTLTPLLARATQLLVEAGPEEEKALRRDIAENPGLLFLTEGPSLMQQLPAEDWQGLSAALAARNIPAIMAAKMRPWYLASLLAVPPCDMGAVAAGKGLDHRVMAMAADRGLPVRALEPHTTLFTIFDTMSAEDQLAMLRSSLLMEDHVADFSATMADAYFRGESRRIWEFLRLTTAKLPGYTPDRANAEFAQMETLLMTRRNQSWIPVIEEAAAQGETFVAFGALHLAGEQGVLNLLAQRGWTITQLSP